MSEPKQIIAIDLDDVLADENGSMRKFINETYNLDHTPEEYLAEGPWANYWETAVWKAGEKEGAARYQAYLDSGVLGRHALVPGARDGINRLKKQYDLVIITSRGDEFADVTHQWLLEYFPDIFESIEFMSTWSKDAKTTKAAVGKALGAAYLIDDHPEHCQVAVEAGLTALLFGELGWNKYISVPQGVVRVKDWDAVMEYFNV